MINCDKQRLQTSVSINLWKILAGHTGDWFDVKTASICTTELWDALKSFILTSLKFKVAPYPIIVSLDTLKEARKRFLYCAWGAWGEREGEIQRERERERERVWDGSDDTLVALKLARNFALFVAKTLKFFFIIYKIQTPVTRGWILEYAGDGRWILHLSLPKICTLVLAKSFALFLAKNWHLSFSPLEGRWVHTFRCQKRCALRNSSRSSFCFCQMAWQRIEAPKQTIEFPAAPSFFSSKK